jgi:N-acetylglucosaminyldiphosphoundecaprenol N-acetyl-beta-D-mannosaminyltransferase
MSPSEIPRADLLGTGISAINMQEAVRLIESRLASGVKGYVCVTGVHGIMEAQRDPEFRRVLNKSFLTTPDGMPTVWVGRLQGHLNMGRVYGPDLMLELCKLSVNSGYKHYLYGGRLGVAERLAASLATRFPGIKIVGTYTPPFRRLNEDEENELIQVVARLKPDLFWVGLSTPKQERFMAEYLPKLETKLMVGVGAAFDIHAGLLKDSPSWVKKTGMQWCHRLIQEPKRLWKRYLLNNPRFLWHVSLQLAGLRSYSDIK